jgi:hypothetical protein
MNNNSTTPEEAAEIRASWQLDPEAVRQRMLDSLAERGVDTDRLTWLSSDETDAMVQHWMGLGAYRYGRLALIPPPDSNVRRGEFEDGTLPPWLDTTSRDIFVSFSRPSGGPKRIARCEFSFVVENLVALARADGDGFAALTPDLEGVLLVNVEEELGASVLEIDAWGEFIRDDKE